MEAFVPVAEFNSALWNRFNDGKIRNVYPKAKYDHIIKKIKSMEVVPPVNSPGEYYLLRKFVIAKVGEDERLACKNLNAGIKNGYVDASSKIKFYIALEEIYNFIEEAHRATNHGGRDRIVRHLQQQGVVNIARDTVELFLSFCKICRPRQKEVVLRKSIAPKNSRIIHLERKTDESDDMAIEDSITIEPPDTVVKAVLIKTESQPQHSGIQPSPDPAPTFRRGHVAILDLTASPDGDYRFMLVYLDYQTRFTILRPVKCKCTYEISSHLLDIFTFIGPPQILHSDYDSPFLSTVIQTLKQSWPQCVIVCSQDNSNSDQAKQCISDVESMLKDWIRENNSHRWSLGLRFVQLRKNTKITSEGGKSPYERFFGQPPQTLPLYLDASLEKEEDLVNAVAKHRTQMNKCEELQVSLDPNVCSLVQNSVLPGSLTHIDSPEGIDTSVVKAEPPESDGEELSSN